LLFATDARMTVLVHLALVTGTVRVGWLWQHLRAKPWTALEDMVERGLIYKWRIGRDAFVALDPCHPAARELREMLTAIGNLYGFKPMPQDVVGIDAGAPSARPSRPRDVRETFGNIHRTMVLLLVHILGEVAARDIERCLTYEHGRTVSGILYMFKAFGLLKARSGVLHKRHAVAFSFNEEHPLTPHVRAVLGALEETMPYWRVVAKRQKTGLIPRSWDRHNRRKPDKWRRPPAV
jgi:hypothetical protein